MSESSVVTYEEVKDLFEYDPETGILTRNARPVGTRHSLGYLKLKLKGKTYFVHRIIFLYWYGRWPVRIDHINRDKSDNRISNLRECSHSSNNANRRLMSSNSSGFKGVHWQKTANKWRAQIGYEVIGHYDNKEEAADAYDKAAIQKYGESALTNKELGLS